MKSLVFACLLLTGLTLSAQAAELKIAYIDMNRALNEVEDGKAAKAQLKKDFDGKQKQLDSLQKELKAKKDDFDKKAAMMKPEVRSEKQEELQKSFIDLQQTYSKLQKELLDRESELTQQIYGKIRKIIEKMGDREGYSIVLDIGNTVLYYKRHMEITDDVVKEYNGQFSAKK